MTPVAVIVNPAAGRGRGEAIWRQVESLVRERLGSLTVHRTAGPGDPERIASAECRKHGVLVLVGGDGTVHESVNGLLEHQPDCAIAVIPAGTGNDFCRNLALPLDPARAAAALDSTRRRLVDVGGCRFRVGEAPRVRFFVNSLSLGLSARANRIARHLRWLPGDRRYVLAGLAAILLQRPRHYEVSTQGFLLNPGRRLLNLTVANGACYAGGLRISPDSVPDDGRLEVVTVTAIGWRRALQAFARLRRGEHLRRPESLEQLAAARGVSSDPFWEKLRIVAREARLQVEADGENFEVTGELEVEVVAGCLAVLG